MRLIHDLWERIRALLFRRREELELEEELAFHVEEATQENIRRGMSADEARRHALMTLGGIERTKEDVRDAFGTQTFENLVRDFRVALRRLIRERSFALPTIASIMVGVGVTTAVLAMASTVLIKPLPYPYADRLVQIGHTARRADLAVTGLSPGIFVHYRNNQRAFDAVGVYLEYAQTITDNAEAPERVEVASVSADLFDALSVTPFLGRVPTLSDVGTDRQDGVVISHDLWVRRYGSDRSIVGKSIEVDRNRQIVMGVTQPGFHFPRPDTDMWQTANTEELLSRFATNAAVRGLFLGGIGRIAEGTPREAAEADLNRLVATLPDAYADVTSDDLASMEFRAAVVPLKDAMVGNLRPALLLLAVTGGVLLLMTWVNAANLSLVRADKVRREIAVERALGATDGRLRQRFLSESILLAAAGGLLGFGFAATGLTVRFGLDVVEVPRVGEVGVDGVSIALALGLTVVTTIILSVVSGSSIRRDRSSSQVNLTSQRSTADRSSQSTRRVLVVAQIGMAMILLIASALMARSYEQLATVDLGFRPDRAVTFLLPVPANTYENRVAGARVHRQVLEQLRALPGVEAAEAATTSTFPLTPVPDYYNDRVTRSDAALADSASAIPALFGFATPGYFEAMDIPLVAGTWFDGTSSTHVLLSASLARELFGTTDAVGRQVRSNATGDGDHHVVGVVGDLPSRSIREGPTRAIYFPNITVQEDTAAIVARILLRDEQYVVRTSLPEASVLPAIRQVVDTVDPKLVMSGVSTLDRLVADSLAQARLTMLLLLVGAATALVLGLIGIYGVLSYAVRQRARELGMRVALGATPTGIVQMMVLQGARLAVIGIVLGCVTALGVTRYLESLLYQVRPNEPMVFIGTALALLAVSLAASYVPALRASRIDPVRVLRSEG